MRNQLRFKWVLGGAVAMGLAGFVVPAAWAKDRDEDMRTDDATERPIRYDDLPRPIKKFFDEEKGRVRPEGFRLMRTPRGEEFYRGVVDEGETRRVIRVSRDGRPLGEDDIKRGDRRYDDYLGGDRRDDRREADRGGDLEGREIGRDAIPGRAMRAIEREGGGRVEGIREVTFRGMTLYRAEVRNRDGSRVVFVSPDGTLYGGRDEITGGLREITLNDVPRGVRETVRREGDVGDVRHVFTSRRGGSAIYTVVIENRRGTNWITCDEDGHVITNVDR